MQLKEEGNRHFQLQDYKAATKSYSQALKLTKDKALLATLYRNRAACGLKTVRGRAGGRGRGWDAGTIHPPSPQPSLLGPAGWRGAPLTAFLDLPARPLGDSSSPRSKPAWGGGGSPCVTLWHLNNSRRQLPVLRIGISRLRGFSNFPKISQGVSGRARIQA